MKIEDLAQKLKTAYFGASDKKRVVSIHLFGIRYAQEIEGKSCKEIAVRAGINESYGTEIRKGMNLAEYVSIKASK
jgi:hypothetical protein